MDFLSKNSDGPAADSEDGPDPVEFDFGLALSDEETDIKEHRRRVEIEENFGKILGQLIVSFELISNRVQQRTGRPHVSNRSPRASPENNSQLINQGAGWTRVSKGQ